MYGVFLLMIRLPPRSTRTDTLFPYTTPSDLACTAAMPGDTGKSTPVDNPCAGVLRKEFGRSDDREAPTPELTTRARTGRAQFPFEEDSNAPDHHARTEEHTSELQSLMRISYAVFCLKKNTYYNQQNKHMPIYNTTTKQQAQH